MRVLCGPLDDHDWDQVNFREPSLNWPDTSLRTVLEFSGVTGQDLPDSASIVGAKGKVSLLSGKWTPVTQ